MVPLAQKLLFVARRNTGVLYTVRYEPIRALTNLPSVPVPQRSIYQPGPLEETVTAFFRLKTAIALTCIVFSAVVIASFWTHARVWESTLSILVRNTRSAAEVAPTPSAPQSPTPVDDAEIGTEIQLLSGNDLHTEVAKSLHPGVPGTALSADVKLINSRLSVIPIPRTALIKVVYRAGSASEATSTLKTLMDDYLTYRLKLHGGQQALEFFTQQAAKDRKELDNARAALAGYEDGAHLAALPEQTDLTLRKLTEVRSQLDDTVTEAGEVKARTDRLTNELTQLAPRLVTQQKAVPNQYSLERLNTSLLELRNRRSSLLTQYKSDDRRVTELDSEIAQTQAAINAAQASHETEETTDVNPVRQSFETELAKARVASAANFARRQTLIAQAAQYEDKLHALSKASGSDQQLQLAVRQAEENYSLSSRKLAEARMNSSLDSNKIANVTVADGPTVPTSPDSRFGLTRILMLILGNLIIIATFTAIGIRHRTLLAPWEAEALTGLPVVATIPFEAHAGLYAPALSSHR